MKNNLHCFAVVLSMMLTSCHCSNHNFDEFEGEYHDSEEKSCITDKDYTLMNCNKDYKAKRGKTKFHRSSTFYDELNFFPISESKNQDVILTRKAYTVAYNQALKIPNWVAWHLTAEHTDGEVKRFNGYIEDEEVPKPRATNEDYRGSGWSHGHMCPAGDNKWDETAMKESNFLTNICPQDRSLNSGLWNKIEQDCRKWAKKYGDLYIVCGPVLLNSEHETIGENKVVVPEAYFKVILCLQGKAKALGYIIRNSDGMKKHDLYINTVDEVERITGYDFFPALPDSIENVVEAFANIDDWK